MLTFVICRHAPVALWPHPTQINGEFSIRSDLLRFKTCDETERTRVNSFRIEFVVASFVCEYFWHFFLSFVISELLEMFVSANANPHTHTFLSLNVNNHSRRTRADCENRRKLMLTRQTRSNSRRDSVLLSNWSNNVCTLQQQRALSFLNQRRNQFQSAFCHVRCSCYPSTILILLARMTTAPFILHIPRCQVKVLGTCRSAGDVKFCLFIWPTYCTTECIIFAVSKTILRQSFSEMRETFAVAPKTHFSMLW